MKIRFRNGLALIAKLAVLTICFYVVLWTAPSVENWEHAAQARVEAQRASLL